MYKCNNILSFTPVFLYMRILYIYNGYNIILTTHYAIGDSIAWEITSSLRVADSFRDNNISSVDVFLFAYDMRGETIRFGSGRGILRHY